MTTRRERESTSNRQRTINHHRSTDDLLVTKISSQPASPTDTSDLPRTRCEPVERVPDETSDALNKLNETTSEVASDRGRDKRMLEEFESLG